MASENLRIRFVVEVKAISFENWRFLLRNSTGRDFWLILSLWELCFWWVLGDGSNSIGADENLIQNWSHGGPH